MTTKNFIVKNGIDAVGNITTNGSLSAVDINVSNILNAGHVAAVDSMNLNVSQSSNPSGQFSLTTLYSNIIIGTNGVVSLQVGDATSQNTYAFNKTYLAFPDASHQSTAWLGMSSYTTDSLSEGSTNKYFSTELAQDAAATAIVTNGSHTGILVTYDDAGNAINFTNSGVTSVNSVTGAVTATNLLDAIKTVDGSGSGLDADTIDGHDTAYFATSGHDHSGVYQPIDGDLTAIAALTGTSGHLRKTAANTWDLDTADYALNSSLSSYALTTDLSSYYTKTASDARYYTQTQSDTNFQPKDADLTAIAGLSGTSGFLKTNGSGTWTVDTNSYSTTSHNHNLTNLTDVNITSVSTGQVISWDSATSKWINQSISFATVTLQSVTNNGATTSNAVSVTNTTQSTSTSTGALIVSGGVGITKDLFVGGNISLAGNIDITGTITGSLSEVNVTNLNVSDSLIYLADGNLTSDTVDIGIYGAYRPSGDTSGHKHTGLVRDHSDSGKWKLISGAPEVVSNDVDFAAVGVTYDTLKLGAIETSTPVSYLYGGTGLSSLGTAGQVLKVNSGATGLEWGASSGGATYTAQATPPSSPAAGDVWIDTDTGIEYKYFNDGNTSQWVELAPGGYFGPPSAPTYSFSTTTTAADPGNGTFRYNNATLSSVTAIYIDNLDSNGNTKTSWYDTWDDSTSTIKGHLILSGTATTDSAVFSVSSITANTGYYTIAVTYVTGGSSVPSNGSVHSLIFNRTGDKGDTGPTGSAATIAVGTVTTGAAGSSATVTNSGTSGAAVFDFSIPRGAAPAYVTSGVNRITSNVATSSTTETQMLAYTIPANTSVAGDTYRFTAFGARTGTQNSSVTITARIGTTTLTGAQIATVTSSNSNAAGGFTITGLFTVRSTGATGTIIGGAEIKSALSSSAVATGTATSTIDTTVSNILEITLTSGNTSNVYTISSGIIEKVNGS